MADSRSLVIFGCGYVGGHLARAALADGQRVRVCARNVERLARLGELGAEVRAIDAARHKQFGPALIGVPSPVVVYSIPPPPGVPAGESVRRAGNAALASTAAPPLTPAVYCVADDRPSRQREYAGWLAAHLHLPPPASGAAPTAHRGRRVKNERMKRELGVTLRYGSFVEGEQQIDEAEAAAAAPSSP